MAIPDSQVTIPKQIYANAYGSKALAEIKQNYLLRRHVFLQALLEGRLLFFSTDADGTCTFKTAAKVENSRSIGSLSDKAFLRLFVKALRRLGCIFEVNTARTGVLPGPSAVGSEGPRIKKSNGEFFNPRSPNEISGILHEFGIHNVSNRDNKKIYDSLVINGLSGSIRHHPTQGLKIADSVLRYTQFIDKLNSHSVQGAENGFLAKIEEIVANKAEKKPLKVLEYKSIPEIFIKHPEFTIDNYLRYIDLVEQARDNSWSNEEFFYELNKSGVQIPATYYDPANPPSSEEELSNNIRKGKLCCLVPHAFDSDNVVRTDKKFEIYKVLAKFCRDPEIRAWAEKEFKLPAGADLFSINGKDVSHINFDDPNFTVEKFVELVKELKDKGSSNNSAIIKVVENLQPYCELAPNSSKADVLPSLEEVQKHNFCTIAAGDSPGSDAEMLAQAIVLGGSGVIVRGLMTTKDVAGKIVEQLALEKNSWHKFALKDLGKDKKGEVIYQTAEGEIKTKSELTKEMLKNYEKQMLRCNNIHENNAFNAAIVSEFFSGDPEFSLELDEKHAWAQDVLAATNKKSLTTPISLDSEKALLQEEYVQALKERFPFINRIPYIKELFELKNAGPIFDTLLNGVSYTLMLSGPASMLGELLKMPGLAYTANFFRRVSYGINNLASGISRGLLLSAHQFPWQCIGEVFGLVSTFCPTHSTIGEALRALSNLVLLGRSNELAMRSNYNLDEFSKDAETAKAVAETYQGKAAPYKDKVKVFSEKNKARMEMVDKLQYDYHLGKLPIVGSLFAKAAADFMQAAKMAYEFVTIRALNKHAISNFFGLGQAGLTKVSKNSGKEYGEVHEEHTYAFAGMLTATLSGTSMLLNMLGFKSVAHVFSNAANMTPALGIVTAGKLTHQDQAGDPRLFTDINKKQQNFSPEVSGLLQTVAGWGQFISGAFMHTSWGPGLYDFFTGSYLQGIKMLLKVGIDDSVVNQSTRQNKYYVDVKAVSRREQSSNLAKNVV